MTSNCKCPNLTCLNRGKCTECMKNHHKLLHTYCRAGKLEQSLRKIYAGLAGQDKK